MKKLLLLLAAAALLIAGAAAGEPTTLLEEHGLTLQLLSVERSEGEALLTLHCVNQEDQTKRLLLFSPEADGQHAGFLYGWPTDEIALAPLETKETLITIRASDPSQWIETVSFRIVDQSDISSKVTIDLLAQTASPASFSWQDQEPALADLTPIRASTPLTPIRYQDALTAGQAENLVDVWLRIALRVQDGTSVPLIPFASTAAHVAPDGSISAEYSGRAIVCSDAPQFPLRMIEEHSDGAYIYQTGDLTLAGPFIFYASMQMTMCENPADNTVQLLSCALDSFDTGPLQGAVPLALFDQLHLVHTVYRVIPGNSLELSDENIWAEILLPEETLTFSVIPAEDLGKVVAYFEYYFNDGTSVIHPAVPLQND